MDKFDWDQGRVFEKINADFLAVREISDEAAAFKFEQLYLVAKAQLNELDTVAERIDTQALGDLESLQFQLISLAAAHPELFQQARDLIHQIRERVLAASQFWQVSDEALHQALYRIIYGGRAAIEEALVQSLDNVDTLTRFSAVASVAPSAVIQGVKVHSGDILLSRGGAPTSALIARGNPYPGQFSHAAMVYVDPLTHQPIVIEALLERGVVLTSVEEYLGRTSLRILLLRLRANDPVLKANPLAAHDAATYMYQKLQSEQLPYDFSMNWNNDDGYFCSQVIYKAYQQVGIALWAYKSKVNAEGLRRWLGQMGVRHFTMIIPSDLEYEPRLAPVAEWLKLNTLKEDRYDSAILDVLLDTAEQGYNLEYSWYKRIPGAMLKGVSVTKDMLGKEPTIPKGMSTDSALRLHSLTEKIHPLLKASLKQKAETFYQSKGYQAPYWQLLAMAKESFEENKEVLLDYFHQNHKQKPTTHTQPKQ